MRERALTSEDRLLALATKAAVERAGGLAACAAATGKSDSQLSRCCNPNLPDSVSSRDAVTIDAIGGGELAILRAMARLSNAVVFEQPFADLDPDGVGQSVLQLGSEFGDVARSVSDGLRDGELSEGELIDTLNQLHELDTASARLRHMLDRLLAAKREGQA